MTEYIEREAAVAVCSGRYKECLRKSDMCGDTVAWNIGFEIKQIPAADVEPVRHGRWVDKKEWHFGRWVAWYECSCCGERDENYEMYEMMPFCSLSNYCPNCGARMDLEVSE